MRLDHVNIRTARLEEMRGWYVRALGLADGPRPDFPFPGAWLYAGEHAVVHLVEVGTHPDAAPNDLRIEHFALACDEPLDAFRARLSEAGVTAQEARVPGTNLLQLNVLDPDGNHIHIDFEDLRHTRSD